MSNRWHIDVSGPNEAAGGGDYYYINATISISSDPSALSVQPRFSLPIVQLREIPLKFFVAESSRGEIAADAETITRDVWWVNAIYSQVGIRFTWDGHLTVITKKNAWNIVEDAIVTNENNEVRRVVSDQLRDVLGSYTSNDCVEVYYVGSVTDCGGRIMDPSAVWTPYGIAVEKDAPSNALAHELGHALGLEDCYSEWGDLKLPIADNAVDMLFFGSDDGDWGLESGRGFYESSDTCQAVMQRLLMYGTGDGGLDVPDGDVVSFEEYPGTDVDIKFSKVGAKYIKSHNSEVYSR